MKNHNRFSREGFPVDNIDTDSHFCGAGGMPRRFATILVLAAGCQTSKIDVQQSVEARVADVAPVNATMEVIPVSASALATQPGRVNLAMLWKLTLANNPGLREAAADVEAASGRQIQAGLYPNPRLLYSQDTIGSDIARPGNTTLEYNQEIVTGGKRRLDIGVARKETEGFAVGLVGRKFEVLTRVRRAYYDYLGQRYLLELTGETVATLERGVEITRQQVEKAKTRPQTDLLRLEALLAEAKINQSRARDATDGAWRQLVAEVGVPGGMPEPPEADGLPEAIPGWNHDGIVRRVLSTNTLLKQAGVEVERARLAVDRAKASAIPNVSVGGGLSVDRTDQTAGGLVSAETALPLWDRQQGRVHEAKAKLAHALASVHSTETRLSGSTAEAYARYKAASRQVERLNSEVLPRLRESLDLLRKAYQAGSAQVTFNDLLTTEQNLLTTRQTLAEARRTLWMAVADLRGLMQLDVTEEDLSIVGIENERPAPSPLLVPSNKDIP